MGPNDKKASNADALIDDEELELAKEDEYIDSLIAIYTNEKFDDEDDVDLLSESY